ncbi:MAG: hypothetical protein WCF23_03540 [Candidatus Nitrosopolaris sp.]
MSKNKNESKIRIDKRFSANVIIVFAAAFMMISGSATMNVYAATTQA